MRTIAKWLTQCVRFFWRLDKRACHYCGGLVGMNSTFSKYGCTCENCLDSLKRGRVQKGYWVGGDQL